MFHLVSDHVSVQSDSLRQNCMEKISRILCSSFLLLDTLHTQARCRVVSVLLVLLLMYPGDSPSSITVILVDKIKLKTTMGENSKLFLEFLNGVFCLYLQLSEISLTFFISVQSGPNHLRERRKMSSVWQKFLHAAYTPRRTLSVHQLTQKHCWLSFIINEAVY